MDEKDKKINRIFSYFAMTILSALFVGLIFSICHSAKMERVYSDFINWTKAIEYGENATTVKLEKDLEKNGFVIDKTNEKYFSLICKKSGRIRLIKTKCKCSGTPVIS